MRERDSQIFIVDDDPDDRDFLHEALASQGYTGGILEFENGADLMNSLNGSTICPDLILLDLNMPVKSGFQTLSELKCTNICKETRIVILTASSRQSDKIKCNELGCDDYLCKPLSLPDYKTLATQVIQLVQHP